MDAVGGCGCHEEGFLGTDGVCWLWKKSLSFEGMKRHLPALRLSVNRGQSCPVQRVGNVKLPVSGNEEFTNCGFQVEKDG